MRKLPIVLAALLSFVATPALAQSLSAEVSAGTNFKNEDVSYGVGVGLDLPLTNSIVVGLEASAEDFINDNDTTILYGGTRLGLNVTDGTLLFINGGYVRASGNGGYRVGTGIEQNLTSNVYTKLAYDYTDFGNGNNDHGGTIGLGRRF